MTSLRSRIAAGIAIGAALISIPLTAGAANAADWVVAGGGYATYLECWEDGIDYINQDHHDYTQFDCRPNGGSWTMWVR
ncbi:hypothetical protein ACFO4E_21900 [Nocardiopsis mangrovi]|uniref:Uncharacterized protein n=1 Tax=Nocardiopsis mangrovi TaxID=1179818 RepID=A0ABV9E1P0_9ACTN